MKSISRFFMISFFTLLTSCVSGGPHTQSADRPEPMEPRSGKEIVRLAVRDHIKDIRKCENVKYFV